MNESSITTTGWSTLLFRQVSAGVMASRPAGPRRSEHGLELAQEISRQGRCA